MKTVQIKQEFLHVVNQLDAWSVLRQIAKQQTDGDPFYLCNIDDVVNKHTIWQTLLPRIKPHYAMKCNDNHIVLQALAALGAGFDCASKVEISKVLSMGVAANRIIYANPVKAPSHICYASSVGVNTTTFDNECELYKMQKLFPSSKLVIRIRSDAREAQFSMGEKFGCDPITEAPKLLCQAKSLNLDVIGVSFHVGSGCREPKAFYRSIHAARKLFDYAVTLGYKFTLLDIGGGYPGEPVEYEHSIQKMTISINKALDDFFPETDVDIISEPGRYYASSAFTLASSINCIKEITKGDTVRQIYYINDGAYGSLNCVLNEARILDPLLLNASLHSKLYPSSIWGPTCDGEDLVAKDVMLPKMGLGDWFIFECVGAYSVPLATQFNGFPLPKIHYVISKDTWLSLKNSITHSEENLKQNGRLDLFQHHIKKIIYADNHTDDNNNGDVAVEDILKYCNDQ